MLLIFQIIQHLLDLFKLGRGRFVVTQRLDDQLGRRAAEESIDHLTQQVFLCFFFAHRSLVDMRFEGIVPFYKAFFMHYLHQL